MASETAIRSEREWLGERLVDLRSDTDRLSKKANATGVAGVGMYLYAASQAVANAQAALDRVLEGNPHG